MVLFKQGRYEEAEPLFTKALGINKKSHGPDHLETAATFNNLAMLFQNKGRYAEAEQMFKSALAIYVKSLGPNHFKVATILSNIGFLHQHQGRYPRQTPSCSPHVLGALLYRR
jgi:tetratricopeptide (TPR) repeat protein